jgi:hypothetical protein
VSPREAMLNCMKCRAVATVPVGEPIIPEGPTATSHDIQEFKRLVKLMGYEANFGESRAVTKPSEGIVELTAKCTAGILSDEFLHVWNNFAGARGRYLDPGVASEHKALGSTFRLSGSSNDRRFHQLELQNYAVFLEQSGAPIPMFLWRAFNALRLAGKE